MEKKIKQAAEYIKKAMEVLGFDLNSPDFKETPKRVAKWWAESATRPELPKITSFPNDPDKSELVMLRDIALRTICPHHLVPVFGKVHVGYIPHKKKAGLSKIIRIVRWCSVKPITQEDLTGFIADTIMDLLEAKGSMVIIEAIHTCMFCRGVKDSAKTITSAIRGIFRNPPEGKDPREEMLQLLKISEKEA